MTFSFFTSSAFKANWKPGLTVSLVSIPLSISLAIASGAGPIAGIITAIWAGLIGALCGGSNYNIIGPTGALSGFILSYALLQGPDMIPLLAIMTGLFVILAYLCKLERFLIFVPSSVIHGFTLGIACIIGLSQLNFACGLQNLPKHEKFMQNLYESLQHVGHISWPTCIVFMMFLCSLLLLRQFVPKIPGAILLSPLGIAIGYATTHDLLPIDLITLGKQFGNLKPYLLQFPSFTFDPQIVLPAAVIAFIAIIETMLSAKIADVMTKTKHNPRKELFGLGLANIASGLVGGIPATAALARTALNVKTGATSRLSAMLNSIFIVLWSFVFLSFFSFIPMAVIAAILVYTALNMIEREHFDRLYQHDKKGFAISMLVAAITIFIDPIVGILGGIALALLVLIQQLAQSYHEVVTSQESGDQKVTKNILTYSFKGKLVYLNSQAHVMRFQTDFKDYTGVILVLQDVYYIDLDGVDALEEIVDLIQQRGQTIKIVSPHEHITNMLHSSKKFQELEQQEHIFDSLAAALTAK